MGLLVGAIRESRRRRSIVLAAVIQEDALLLLEGSASWSCCICWLFALKFDIDLLEDARALHGARCCRWRSWSRAAVRTLQSWRLDFNRRLLTSETERNNICRRHRIRMEHRREICEAEVQMLMELSIVDGSLGWHWTGNAR